MIFSVKIRCFKVFQNIHNRFRIQKNGAQNGLLCFYTMRRYAILKCFFHFIFSPFRFYSFRQGTGYWFTHLSLSYCTVNWRLLQPTKGNTCSVSSQYLSPPTQAKRQRWLSLSFVYIWKIIILQSLGQSTSLSLPDEFLRAFS
ncbi:hypothetical protein SDC9_80067 [bioreactor metagenome]|uniref:Uncharacterized protein n=1 Tax=bioreactor metagenome TaxID=1076179 RepID=A0A644Z0F9_9ZZZZ